MELQVAVPPLRTTKSILGLGNEVVTLLDGLGADLIEDIHMEAGMRCRFPVRSDVQVLVSGVHRGARWAIEIYLQECDGEHEREAFLFPLDATDPSLIALGVKSSPSLRASCAVRDQIAAQLLGLP